MNDMMQIVKAKYGATTDAQPTNEDDLCEQAVETLLGRVPTALGTYAGRVLSQVLAYGDYCGWTPEEDAEVFVQRFLEGFKAGLDADERPESWPDRERVIAAFGQVAYIAERGLLIQHMESSGL